MQLKNENEQLWEINMSYVLLRFLNTNDSESSIIVKNFMKENTK